jgi:phage repressor protein C with HTH and peptisase S24 domain
LDDLLYINISKTKKVINSKSAGSITANAVAYRPFVITVDESGNENIVLVDTKAAAGYPTRYLEPEFYKELPAFKLPGSDYRNGTFRCFQVAGESMMDTLLNGDYVVGRFCDNHFRDVREGHIHIVVTADQVLVKRILNRAETEHKLILISDNEEFEPLDVTIDEVKEIWLVKSKISTHIPVKKNDLDKLIGDLTSEMQMLKRRIDNMEKN